MKTIDLGRKPETCSECPAPVPSKPPTPDVYYPTLYLSNIEGLSDLPEEGTATVRFKVRSRTVSERNKEGKKTSVDLDILSLSEISGPKKSKSSREESEEALKKLAEEEEGD